MKFDEQRDDLAHPQLSVRAVLIEDGKVLLVQHDQNDGFGGYWVLPGGGVETDEPLVDAVKREVLEETFLVCEPIGIIDIREVVMNGVRGIEVYFLCDVTGGNMQLGSDPEFGDQQVLKDSKWFSSNELTDIVFLPPGIKDSTTKWLETGEIPMISVPPFDVLEK